MATVVSEVLGIVDDQLSLLALEWRLEKRFIRRKLVGIACALAFFFSAFFLLQIALISALVHLGWKLEWVCLGLGCFYLIGGGLIINRFFHRDPRLGRPFEASQHELRRTIQWMQRFF